MAVLIKNMEMPRSCEECRFHDAQVDGCSLMHCFCLMKHGQDKPSWCPMVEVHGDLIERTILLQNMADWQFTVAPEEGWNYHEGKMVTDHERQYEAYLTIEEAMKVVMEAEEVGEQNGKEM